MWDIYFIHSWQLYLNFLWFIIALFISWFIPGLTVLSFTKLPKTTQFYLSPVVGLCLCAIQGYAFGWLGIRSATYLFLVVFAGAAYLRRQHIFPLSWRLAVPPYIWLTMIAGTLVQLVPVVGSGVRTSRGVVYYFVNIFDGVFHVALGRALVDAIPPFQPGAMTLPVTNYHYLSDLTMAELTRIWQLPLNHLYFHFIPIFMSLWMGLILFTLLKKWSSNHWTIFLGLTLYFFVGELSWLVNILLGSHASVPFEVFIDHGAIQFLNVPQAYAKLVFFSTIILWDSFIKKKELVVAGCLALMISTLLGFKVYFGLASAVGALASLVFYTLGYFGQVYHQKKSLSIASLINDFYVFLIFGILLMVLSAAIYLPANANAGGLFFDFLAWPKLMLGFSKLNWDEWWLRLAVYQEAGSMRNLTIWYGLAAGIFVTAMYHLRTFGLLTLHPRWRQQVSPHELVYTLIPALVMAGIGANFLQSSGGFNTFNFTVVALSILNLLTAVGLGSLTHNKVSGKLLVMCLLAVTCVQTFMLQKNYFTNYRRQTDSYFVSANHEAALTFLAEQPRSSLAIQTHPRNHLDQVTPYLYFYTGQPSYFGGRGILESHNQPYLPLKKNIGTLFTSDASESAALARTLKIKYLLLEKTDGIQRDFYWNTMAVATRAAYPTWREAYGNQEFVVMEVEN